jgi:hippurate hydrolase
MKSMRLIAPALVGVCLLVVPLAWSQGGNPPASTKESGQLEAVFPDAYALYLDLHQHPELSSHETRTAALLAERLRKLGYEVTEHVGGTGVVGIMKNGPGPTVMLRTELDALPVEEKDGSALCQQSSHQRRQRS